MKVKLHIQNFGDWSHQTPPSEAALEFFKGGEDSEIHIFEDNKLAEHVNYKDKIKIRID